MSELQLWNDGGNEYLGKEEKTNAESLTIYIPQHY